MRISGPSLDGNDNIMRILNWKEKITKKRIINDLPNFPKDVIDQFLWPYSVDLGWPPGQRRYDANNRWFNILRQKDLLYWQRVNWNKKALKLTPHQLIKEDCSTVTKLFLSNVMECPNSMSNLIIDSKERFDSICEYLKQKGRYPKTVAVERLGEKYQIIDGCHRLTAYFYLRGWFGTDCKDIVLEEQDYWVAEFQ